VMLNPKKYGFFARILFSDAWRTIAVVAVIFGMIVMLTLVLIAMN